MEPPTGETREPPPKPAGSWGPALAALTLGVLALLVGVAFWFGIRGLF